MGATKGTGQGRRKLIKVLIAILSVLTLDLAFSVVNKVITTWRGDFNNYWLNGFGMLVIVLLFLPAVSIPDLLNKAAEKVLGLTFSISRRIINEWLAIFLVFFLVLFLLYVGFYWAWFDKLLFFHELDNVDLLDKIKSESHQLGESLKSFGK